MKSDNLTRSTYLKKTNENPSRKPVLYDLVDDGVCQDSDLFAIDDLYRTPHISFDTLIHLPEYFSEEKDILFWAVNLMRESPLVNSLLVDAAGQGWSVGLGDLSSEGYYLDISTKELWLDHFAFMPSALGKSSYFRNALLTTFIRALRDIWQESAGFVFESEYRPEDLLMLERIRAADCDTVTIQAGWELRGAGFTDVWRYILGSEEGDMAVIFTRFLEQNPGALFDGAALAHTFRQWYASPNRLDGCDHETLEAMDEILRENGDECEPFGRKKLDAADIKQLATLPDGICYLARYSEAILEDPYFAGLGDPINQAHFFHLMYDLDVFMVNNVPFRDHRLARKIFPSGTVVKA